MKKVLTVLLMFSVFTGFAKEDKELADSIKKLIDNKSFVFAAQSAMPTRGGFISLTSTYDVKVTGDTVIAYLPYYGRAHTAVYPGEDDGIKFTSTKSTYTVKERKNGWDVLIKPDDVRNNVELRFNISKSGYVTLVVSDFRRDPITFRGLLNHIGT
jgi:hypothetical protein